MIVIITVTMLLTGYLGFFNDYLRAVGVIHNSRNNKTNTFQLTAKIIKQIPRMLLRNVIPHYGILLQTLPAGLRYLTSA